jgi:acyl dehydratase
MPIDYEKLIRFPIPPVEDTYTERDTMLYALAVGMAADPVDPRELRYTFERDLLTLPTMATVLAWDDSWMYRTGVDMTKQVHGEQRIRIHRPLPAAASVVTTTRIVDLFDKGPGRGAIMRFETEVRDKTRGDLLATNTYTSFARGDGGFGGPPGSPPAPHPIPSRFPDTVFDQTTLPTQALFYRLCGDRNPLHADPEYARSGGFARPILHGLCTFGHACAAVVRACCDYDATRITDLAVRFTRPVFPGDTLSTEMWRDGDVVSFRTRVKDRDEIVLDHGRVGVKPAR